MPRAGARMKLPATLRLRLACLMTQLFMALRQLGSISLGSLGVPAPSILNQWTYGYKDVATKVLGSQTMKFGFDFTQALLSERPDRRAELHLLQHLGFPE